ncbi:ARS-binding factor 2, mitochondrial [Pseudomyrmex gracilis]|uniref:ARS-binding factor 2, mitochondrial n=1 Tax=Pseudomyrmex gracilis TaxID=219809 RepID=UPI000995C38B|nr:ARS-binding factor 2, mitochondrial [Pseudomyrmex gracilis]
MATWRLLSHTNFVNFFCIRRLAQDSVTSKLKHDTDVLPLKPKKPINPFMQYLLTVRSNLQNQYPDYPYKDIIKKASEQWAQLDAVTKQNLQKQYTEQYFAYKQKLIDYEKSLTTDQKILIKEELMRKELVKEKREYAKEKSQIKQKLEELGKPKRPLSAFFLFMQDKMSTKNPEISQKDWMSNISKEWKDMTKEVKTKYIDQARHLTEKYKAELQKWEEDMIKAGRRDLLRSSVKSKRNTSIGINKE